MKLHNFFESNKLEEYGDTAKGQKMLDKVHHRAADKVTSKKSDTDPEYARKAQQTQNRAWERMKDVSEDSLNEFASNDGNGGDDEEEMLYNLVKMWWTGNEQQHTKAAKTLASMGIDIDEDDPNIILRRGKQFMVFPMNDFQQGVSEGDHTKTPSGDYVNMHTGVKSSRLPQKKKRGQKTGAEWDAIEKAKKDKQQGVAEGSSKDLSKVSTEKLQAHWDKHKDQPGVSPVFGQQLKAVARELARRKKQGVAEGHADQQRKIFKKNGKPVGEVGIDRESSPGNGQWYMTCYGVVSYGGYDSYEEAVEELKYCLKQNVKEEWSKKYKDSINCSNPKGFSQKAHCAGKKKHNESRDMCSVCGQTPCNCTYVTETRAYYNVIGTPPQQLRSEFGMRKDKRGWFLGENVDKRKQLAAFRAFGAPKLKEFNLASFSGSAATKGEDNIISPVGSGRKGK